MLSSIFDSSSGSITSAWSIGWPEPVTLDASGDAESPLFVDNAAVALLAALDDVGFGGVGPTTDEPAWVASFGIRAMESWGAA